MKKPTAKPSDRVGYVLKRYPRFSETFIVNEILAHERCRTKVEIFALRPPDERHFQDILHKVKAPINYVPDSRGKVWALLAEVSKELPGVIPAMPEALRERDKDVYQALMIARDVKRRRIGHLHAHFATSAATVARLVSLFTGVSWSLTAHAKDIYHEDVCEKDFRRKLTSASAVVTVSDYNTKYIKDRYGKDAREVKRLYNGLDLKAFSYRSPEERKPLIVSVGRLVEKKGFPVLIQACEILDKKGVDFRCEIVGRGEIRESLLKEIKDRNLKGKVKLLGALPQASVRQKIRRAALFSAPCVVAEDGDRDGIPTVILEALASGTPCVSTDVTGIKEVVRHQETGLLVNSEDPQALAKAMTELLESSELRVKLSLTARALMEELFDRNKNAKTLREFFPMHVLPTKERNLRIPALGSEVLVNEMIG